MYSVPPSRVQPGIAVVGEARVLGDWLRRAIGSVSYGLEIGDSVHVQGL